MPRKQSAKFKVDEPILYEELLDSSSMSGLVSFLDLPAHSTGIPGDGTSTLGIPLEPLNTIGLLSMGTPEKPVPSLGIPTEATVPKGIPKVDFIGIPGEASSPNGIPIVVATGDDSPTVSLSSNGIEPTPIPRSRQAFPLIDQGANVQGNTSIGIPNEPLPLSGIPNLRYAHIIEVRRLRPFRLILVQDGHSRNEQAIYEVLWKDGRQLSGRGAAKSVQIGYGELARRARVSRNSVIRLLISLEKKFSLSRDNKEATQAGSWYTVFGYSTILESRQKAGLLWAVKDRNGVLLLTRSDVVTPHFRKLGIPEEPMMAIPTEPSSGIPLEPPRTVVIPTKHIPGIPTEALPGIPNNGTHPKYVRESSRKDVVADLVTEIKRQTDSPHWDRSAAQLLWDRCGEQGIETVPELMYFFNLKWQIIRLKRNTINAVGLMTKAVPESITSEALVNLRQEMDGNEDDLESEIAIDEWQQRHQAVLDDPGASEQEKRIASAALSHNRQQGRGRNADE